MKTSSITPKQKQLLKLFITEQLVTPVMDVDNPDDSSVEGNENKSTLIPLTPGQIDKEAAGITSKFINNIFASVKTALGPSYYDNDLDKLYKDVKLKRSLENDFRVYVTKVLNTVAKQPTGQEEETVGVNKTNIGQ